MMMMTDAAGRLSTTRRAHPPYVNRNTVKSDQRQHLLLLDLESHFRFIILRQVGSKADEQRSMLWIM